MKLLLGTTNPAKLKHYQKFLKNENIELITPNELGIYESPEEIGEALEENAILKAKFYFEKSRIPTLADDAGFEVQALGNWPGVKSRRINGDYAATDQEIIDTVIKKMKLLGGEERKARMSVVLALQLSADRIFTSRGLIEGIVPEKPFKKLENHFPYRSLLFIPTINKWFYELTEQEENDLGYRKAAFEKILKNLNL